MVLTRSFWLHCCFSLFLCDVPQCPQLFASRSCRPHCWSLLSLLCAVSMLPLTPIGPLLRFGAFWHPLLDPVDLMWAASTKIVEPATLVEQWEINLILIWSIILFWNHLYLLLRAFCYIALARWLIVSILWLSFSTRRHFLHIGKIRHTTTTYRNATFFQH